MECFSDKDIRKIVEKQLSINATNFCKVAKFCSYGFPQVIKSLPIKDEKPFPTLNYLVCPYLIKEVSRLEEKGYIKKFQDEVEADKELREKLVNAHMKVIEERDKFFERDDLKKYEQWRSVLKNVGSGGIKDFSKIKCLHLHLADFLAGIENPIGEKVASLLKSLECDDSYCKRFLE